MSWNAHSLLSRTKQTAQTQTRTQTLYRGVHVLIAGHRRGGGDHCIEKNNPWLSIFGTQHRLQNNSKQDVAPLAHSLSYSPDTCWTTGWVVLMTNPPNCADAFELLLFGASVFSFSWILRHTTGPTSLSSRSRCLQTHVHAANITTRVRQQYQGWGCWQIYAQMTPVRSSAVTGFEPMFDNGGLERDKG